MENIELDSCYELLTNSKYNQSVLELFRRKIGSWVDVREIAAIVDENPVWPKGRFWAVWVDDFFSAEDPLIIGSKSTISNPDEYRRVFFYDTHEGDVVSARHNYSYAMSQEVRAKGGLNWLN
ncbi:MAG: hypothetical protein GY947_22865 [Rhodobacteraceae bacterium]|nr:hypothetical protein [Paracoccaceae bacterium]